MMREKRQRREFTEEFKKQIVTLYNNGKPRVQLIKEYDLPRSVLAKWINQFNSTGSFKAIDNRTPEENKLLELEKENKQLKMENDILKQAALIMGRK